MICTANYKTRTFCSLEKKLYAWFLPNFLYLKLEASPQYKSCGQTCSCLRKLLFYCQHYKLTCVENEFIGFLSLKFA